MLNFIIEHWVWFVAPAAYVVAVLLLARFAGFNQLDKG